MEKKSELVILQPARNEILDIAQKHMELVGPKSARKITDKLHKTLETLRTHPRIGMAMDEQELGRPGFRRIVCGNYLCFYRIIGNSVVVCHVVDGRMDYPRLFAESEVGLHE